jgi:excisionase family DNA binding protein
LNPFHKKNTCHHSSDFAKDFIMKNTTTIFSSYPDVVSVEQLSQMLGISTKTAYRLLKEKKIKAITIGRTYRIPKIFVLDYLEIPH